MLQKNIANSLVCRPYKDIFCNWQVKISKVRKAEDRCKLYKSAGAWGAEMSICRPQMVRETTGLV